MVVEERIVEQFIKLCKIESESKKELPISDYLKEIFKDRGLTIHEDDAHLSFGGQCGNLRVKLQGRIEAPPLLISAHMDTVVTGGEVDPYIEDGVIRSRGDTILGADDRAGLAQIIELIDILQGSDIKYPPILFFITVAEEVNLLGSRFCNLTPDEASMGLILDTSGPIGTIIYSAPYHDSWSIEVHGVSSHAGIDPESGVSAIKRASEIVSQIETGRIDSDSTANIGYISGGKANNIVPDRVSIRGEFRSCTRETVDQNIEKISKLCSEFESRDRLPVVFRSNRSYEGYTHSPESRLIKLLSESAKASNKEPLLKKTNGGSDANHFNRCGIPSAVISCGMAKVHSFDEEITVRDLCDTVEMLLHFVSNYAKEYL